MLAISKFLKIHYQFSEEEWHVFQNELFYRHLNNNNMIIYFDIKKVSSMEILNVFFKTYLLSLSSTLVNTDKSIKNICY